MIFIGIDCGTQSLKTVALDLDSDVRVTAAQAYGMVGGLPPGHKEQDPADWLDALDGCFRILRDKGVALDRVEGIGVSGQQHGFVALDADHRVLRPAKLWCDTSTAGQCSRILANAGGADAYFEEIGNLLPPGFTASKVLWMREREPATYARLRWMLLPHDYLNLHLTGELTSEPGDASGSGYFRVREREWSHAALGWIDSDRDLTVCLPRLIDSSESAGGLRSALAERWGMQAGTLVSSGGGDNMMGAIGTGNVEAGVLTASLGTSGTLYAFSPEPVVDPAGEVAAFCASVGGWLPLACTMNVTVATTAVKQGFGPPGWEQFEAALASVSPGADGLILIPYLEGERLPNVPDGTGVLIGFRGATATAAHLARAAMEGATMGLRQGWDRLRELGVEATEIRLIGGGASSRTWRQAVADVFALPVVCPLDAEGAALGAALQAAWCRLGGDVTEVTRRHVESDESTRCLPDQSRVDRYQDLFSLYQESVRAMVDSPVFQSHRQFISAPDTGKTGAGGKEENPSE